MLTFYWLLVGHALADYPLQGDFLAKAKNHKAPIPGVPWLVCLLAHALICGGMVTAVTGSVSLGLAETAVHALTDWLKNDGALGQGNLGFAIDQGIHVVFKALWVVL